MMSSAISISSSVGAPKEVEYIGYDKAAEIAKRASHENTSLKQAALALGYVTAEDYERWVVPASMTHPST